MLRACALCFNVRVYARWLHALLSRCGTGRLFLRCKLTAGSIALRNMFFLIWSCLKLEREPSKLVLLMISFLTKSLHALKRDYQRSPHRLLRNARLLGVVCPEFVN